MKSTKNLNMDGMEVDFEISQALRIFKNFKQGSILESSYFGAQHTLTDDMNKNGDHLKDAIKREMIGKLNLEVLDKYKDSFEERRISNGTEISLSIISMSASELKHIVEYCIRTMSQSSIEEIRK